MIRRSNEVSKSTFCSEVGVATTRAGDIAGVMMGAGLLVGAAGYAYNAFRGPRPAQQVVLSGVLSDTDVARKVGRKEADEADAKEAEAKAKVAAK